MLIRLDATGLFEIAGGESCLCICLLVPDIWRKSQKESHQVKDQVYQLTRKENLVIFPRDRRGKKARYPLLQAGVISDPRWSSLGEVRRTRVKIEREVPRMCELCKEVLHYLCVLTIPFGERIQCSTIFASLSIFLFLLHSLSPVFSSSAPIQSDWKRERISLSGVVPDFLCVRSFWFFSWWNQQGAYVRDILWDVTEFTMKFRIPAVFKESSIFFVKIKTRSYLCATFFSLSYLSNISRILYLFAEETKKKGCRLFLKYQLRI